VGPLPPLAGAADHELDPIIPGGVVRKEIVPSGFFRASITDRVRILRCLARPGYGDSPHRVRPLGAQMRPAFAAAALALVLATPVHAQQFDRGPDATIDAATRTRVVNGVLQRIEEGYVIPTKAGEMTQEVRERARRGEYDRIVSAHALADSLTAHLRAVSRDRHLHVVYQSQGIKGRAPGG
jgi:hypothetical protein